MEEKRQGDLVRSTESPVQAEGRLVAPVAAGGLILCVSSDINLANREIVPSLEKLGHEVVVMRPDEASLAVLQGRPFGLLLMDINSTESSSYRLCEQSRHVVDIPVMLILRGAARSDVLRGYQAGADAYLFFPFDDRELHARLGGLLRRHPLSRPAV